MKITRNKNTAYLIVGFFMVACLSSCLTSQKMDAYVADQYGNQLPKQNKKLKPEISINSSLSLKGNDISNTVKKTTHVLPLVVYWKYDYRHTCTLNPDIAVSSFSNTLNSMSAKLSQKLNGQHLELTVEQVPSAFALVDQTHLLLVLIHWDKIYVEPDRKDLIVSYKVSGNDSVAKSGKIIIKSLDKDRNIRFFQSWKSSTSEYLATYNANIATMSKSFVTKLLEEL